MSPDSKGHIGEEVGHNLNLFIHLFKISQVNHSCDMSPGTEGVKLWASNDSAERVNMVNLLTGKIMT